jgi:hypothetical protein
MFHIDGSQGLKRQFMLLKLLRVLSQKPQTRILKAELCQLLLLLQVSTKGEATAVQAH